MRRSCFSRRSARGLLNGILLWVLVFRALVPVGYMPSADQPFTLQLCPDSFPAEVIEYAKAAHDGSHGGHHPQPAGEDSHPHGLSVAQHCIFAATLGSAGPPYAQTAFVAFKSSAVVPADPAPLILAAQRYRVQQPRAPPSLI